jgi:outer membrane murein-binding lipoprotein Lpp
MKLAWRSLMVILAVVAGSLLLAACGGGGDGEELSLDEYFQQLDSIEEGIETDVLALDEAATGVIGEDVEATRAYVDGYQGVVGEGVNDMKELDPPSEVGDAHDEFVAALSGMLPLWQDLSDQLKDIETTSDMQTVLMGTQAEESWTTATQRFADACLDLQGIADEKGFDVDLNCE